MIKATRPGVTGNREGHGTRISRLRRRTSDASVRGKQSGEPAVFSHPGRIIGHNLARPTRAAPTDTIGSPFVHCERVAGRSLPSLHFSVASRPVLILPLDIPLFHSPPPFPHPSPSSPHKTHHNSLNLPLSHLRPLGEVRGRLPVLVVGLLLRRGVEGDEAARGGGCSGGRCGARGRLGEEGGKVLGNVLGGHGVCGGRGVRWGLVFGAGGDGRG
jgi:hypothetical protein